MVGRSILVCTCFDTLILQLIVILLTGRKVLICVIRNLFSDVIVVCAIVGDVQSAIAVDEGQVTITVQTTSTSCT